MDTIEYEEQKLRLYHLLQRYQLCVTTAESCTGGMIASGLVDISGISEYFQEGFVTYSNHAKNHLLHVDMSTIEQYGVVSEETARAMALGACKYAAADCAVTTTGVAGPGGGTKDTPVGCVCFGCVVKDHVFSERMIFHGNRTEIRKQATGEAFRFLTQKIEEVMI